MQTKTNTHGFTIIEVLIVLAIAGLVMLIVFMTVPTLQRNSRNYQRKYAADQVASSMAEYYNSNAQQYADSPAAMCTFFTTYASGIGSMTDSCNPTYVSGNHCVLVNLTRFDVCYHDRMNTPHSYIGSEDEISIILGHWCNSGTHYYAPDGTNPITSNGGGDDNLLSYAVWVQLEKGPVYCIDNK